MPTRESSDDEQRQIVRNESKTGNPKVKRAFAEDFSPAAVPRATTERSMLRSVLYVCAFAAVTFGCKETAAATATPESICSKLIEEKVTEKCSPVNSMIVGFGPEGGVKEAPTTALVEFEIKFAGAPAYHGYVASFASTEHMERFIVAIKDYRTAFLRTMRKQLVGTDDVPDELLPQFHQRRQAQLVAVLFPQDEYAKAMDKAQAVANVVAAR